MNQFFRGENGGGELSVWTPQVNVSETDEHYEVEVDLPGLKPEEFNVELRHGDLWITGEHKHESEQTEKTWHRIERRVGQFRRVIRLGDDVDPENVNAEYKDGVLHLTVGKSESAKAKRIEVKA
ncbi:MAG TPA: Hsp20/alpha crystallin family protein [Planctomycetaceae bacterium]|nr:Hsp20/alpha crystallin family protein [Planctomycetaceae bacterium]